MRRSGRKGKKAGVVVAMVLLPATGFSANSLWFLVLRGYGCVRFVAPMVVGRSIGEGEEAQMLLSVWRAWW